jgi:hypothetical protein
MSEFGLILFLAAAAAGWIWVIRLKGGPRQAFRGALGLPWWVQLVLGGLIFWALMKWGR